MGHRLSRIVTRTGDDGTTGLADGSRIAKDATRVEALGAVDELNSVLGVLQSEQLPESVASCLTELQHDLFDLGGELSLPGHPVLRNERVCALEERISTLNAGLPPLREFILPGGTRAAGLAHLARTICRRAERRIVALGKADPVSPCVVQYLNRLSDLLFVIARKLNQTAGRPDTPWRGSVPRR